MIVQKGRNAIVAAAQATAKAMTRREWWRPVLSVWSMLFVVSAALPIFLLLRFGVWRGVTYELSPFITDSLARRLLLPMLGVLLLGLAIAVLLQLAVEIIRVARGRR